MQIRCRERSKLGVLRESIMRSYHAWYGPCGIASGCIDTRAPSILGSQRYVSDCLANTDNNARLDVSDRGFWTIYMYTGCISGVRVCDPNQPSNLLCIMIRDLSQGFGHLETHNTLIQDPLDILPCWIQIATPPC